MNNLKPLTNLNLIWIQNQGYWISACSVCQKTELAKHESEKGGFYD